MTSLRVNFARKVVHDFGSSCDAVPLLAINQEPKDVLRSGPSPRAIS